MAKKSTSFKCQSCGSGYTKWAGRCESCGEWNSIVEELGLSNSGPAKKSLGAHKGKQIDLVPLSGEETPPPRIQSGLNELDRVLGGGLVNASAVLVGGDPGIGKSTLLLQAVAAFGENGAKTIYISGEESSAQVRMRAARLELAEAPVLLATETNIRDILTTLEAEKPDVVIIDSIQTMWADHVESAPGSVSQVRSCAHEITTFAKRHDISVILVGHVTKEGQIAGPRVVEHMVDTVLYFEGERGHQFRILRAVKNRFGPADEIGVFEMTSQGLAEVNNPSALFLGEREDQTAGSVVFAGIEGTRPILVEIQALVAQSSLGTPRRAVVGWDSGRLAMILAVLESRCGVTLSGLDVYLNVAGGLRISEPGADMAVAAALLSAYEMKPIPKNTVIFGEIALSGAIRPVSLSNARLKEAEKLGFKQSFTPSKMKSVSESGIKLQRIETIESLLTRLFD